MPAGLRFVPAAFAAATLLTTAALSPVAGAQIAPPSPEPETEAAAAEDADEQRAEETAEPGEETDDLIGMDDPQLDDQTYEGDEDIFVPTEEIPTDQPIPFPSDI